MSWTVDLHPEFEKELTLLPLTVQAQVAKGMKFLVDFGPTLKRPHADTLDGSSYNNMKELRFDADSGVWRVAFAFDPRRKAILLVAGDKSGGSQLRFYKQLIQKADYRFTQHLRDLKKD
jgi:hypothetical protein